MPRDVAYDIAEQRPYRVHMRMVPTYRKGRMLLAGDAAHLNTPAGGMGLNGGIHDAFELAAALIDVLRHGATEERLDVYDRRRRPIAREDILAQADRNRARMRERDPARRRELLKDLQATANDREKLRAFLRRSSMLEGLAKSAAISLRSAIVVGPGPGVISVGHCFEPNGTSGGRNGFVPRLALSAMIAARASPPISS